MQQNTISVEMSALLDRVLQTSQSLNRALDKYVHNDPFAPQAKSVTLIVETEDSAANAEELTVLPVEDAPVVPVLTIKLADLVREGDAARKRRLQAAHRLRHAVPQKQQPQERPKPVFRRRQRPADRVYREIEVIRRKGLRLVS